MLKRQHLGKQYKALQTLEGLFVIYSKIYDFFGCGPAWKKMDIKNQGRTRSRMRTTNIPLSKRQKEKDVLKAEEQRPNVHTVDLHLATK